MKWDIFVSFHSFNHDNFRDGRKFDQQKKSIEHSDDFDTFVMEKFLLMKTTLAANTHNLWNWIFYYALKFCIFIVAMRLMTTMAMITRKLSNFFFFFFFLKLQTTNANGCRCCCCISFLCWVFMKLLPFSPFRQTEAEERAQKKNFGPKQPCSRKSRAIFIHSFRIKEDSWFLSFISLRCVWNGAVCGNKPVEMIEKKERKL